MTLKRGMVAGVKLPGSESKNDVEMDRKRGAR